MAKRIGILGSGNVGQALGAGFLKHGYTVMIGTRDANKLSDWQAQHAEGRVGSFQEAAAFGEIVVLAVKGSVALDVLEMAGAQTISGKTVIDATNPISNAPPTEGVLHFFTSLEESFMERLQKAYPEARFVKAFSSVGAHLMVNPQLGAVPSMFIAGDDEGAKAEVASILEEFGWETEDMGPAVAARAIEPLCILWCIPGFRENSWGHAFKLLKA